ncbi:MULTISPECIES: ABC transporter substrate-binding protein [unclassified Azospirillum]|uniref:ABC transporter substrate-binding protein n=1 Tax=unclassified Azospirillum TaxID=2630922 RepID=UPI000B6728FA|nr:MULTISPECIES: ABC transporter substrate-binding protein [unclassified Azospirillum]SNT23333.1 NitT/TauT family transport system substrate-binding protein [Azospirillum sp. RU38E]SNT34208.1 NitT/TauT family transport system substrate-binding protein [Azospirillum sp. RU37A]
MRKIVVAAVAAFIGFATPQAPAQTNDHPLRVGWVFAMANAPALIADKKGFYAEQGLTVELKSFGDGPVVQQALAAGELDVAYIGAPPVYQWYARGLDARILAKVNYGQAAVITNDPAIRGLSDLRGRKLAGVARGSGMDVLLRGFVLKEAAGLEPDRDVSLLQMAVGNMTGALDGHTVDAAFTWEPFISQSVLRGTSRVVFDVNQALPSYPWYVVMAPVKTLQSRPDDVVKLLRAHAKAIAFLNDHKEEADRLIAEAFKLEPVTGPDGREIPPTAIVAEARKRLGWSDRLAEADLAFIQRLINYSLAQGLLSQPLDVRQIVDTTYLQQADRK